MMVVLIVSLYLLHRIISNLHQMRTNNERNYNFITAIKLRNAVVSREGSHVTGLLSSLHQLELIKLGVTLSCWL